jgi:hypothetical protein
MTIVPLNDKEEAILELLMQISNLKTENEHLKEEIVKLYWTLEEKD